MDQAAVSVEGSALLPVQALMTALQNMLKLGEQGLAGPPKLSERGVGVDPALPQHGAEGCRKVDEQGMRGLPLSSGGSTGRLYGSKY